MKGCLSLQRERQCQRKSVHDQSVQQEERGVLMKALISNLHLGMLAISSFFFLEGTAF